MNDWWRLLRHVTALTVRTDRRTSAVQMLLTVGQAGVIAALGLSQAWLVDSSAADRPVAVAGAVALGAAAYGISTAAGRVRGNLWTYLVGRVRPRLNEETQRAISSIPTITGPILNERATDLWAAAATHEAGARLRAAGVQAGAWLLYAAGVAAALVVVADLISTGRATVGAAVLVVSLATQVQVQLRAVLTSISEVAEAGQVVSHYWWLRRYVAETARPGAPAPDWLTHGITLHDVHFRYPGAEDVLKGVGLHLPAGSTVAVVGANGAGKSTLIKLLTGLDRAGWRARLSGVYQDFARLRLLTRETVGWAASGTCATGRRSPRRWTGPARRRS